MKPELRAGEAGCRCHRGRLPDCAQVTLRRFGQSLSSQRATIAGLARSLTKDIDRAAAAVAPLGSWALRILATSAIHRQFKLNKAKDEIIKQASEAVAYARSLCADIEFSPEDASRTEPELADVVQAVIEAASTVNIPDTVGCLPARLADLIGYLRANVATSTKP